MAASTTILDAIAQYLSGLWIVWLALAIVFGLVTIWYWFRMTDLKRFAGDILIREACYRNKTTLGSYTDLAGTKIEFECKTNKDSPGLVKNVHTLVNPNLVSTRQRGRLANGIPTLDYVAPYHFPFSKTDALALVQTKEYVRDNFPQLNWVEDDLDIIMLIFCNSKYLYENCVNIVVSYMEMGAELPDDYINEEPEFIDVNGDALELDDDDETLETINDLDEIEVPEFIDEIEDDGMDEGDEE